MSRLIATVCGTGYMRPAPGTWGSAVGVLLALALHYIGGFPLLFVATFVVFFVGWWATANVTRGQADHDPSEVVIDEVAGQWIALWITSYGAYRMGLDPLALYPGWIAAFVLFRFFDITKPNLIGWADRRGDALGVMLDDVIAGVYAAICTGILGALYHLVIL
ncbi:phosphatidylglycerophosphatase A [Cognatishimia sp. 1_MG-2023]|uniref:phosphatidylglycerophosphatase A family protein n=1 Tax=Cognatishimia sp. 1_MG-2023 TaxID=3062642 RepID=UPI0026E45B9C|nr:phosphatidylglycerophosphatase A [Cognatishimia sp. 1_MG-2023]MDO6725454.1 phosphatidylglycerophosphatase A [Cognatishimia sp. 1_MG-2023]